MIAWKSECKKAARISKIEASIDSRMCESIIPIKAYRLEPLQNLLSVQARRSSVMVDWSAGIQDSVGISSECSVAVTATPEIIEEVSGSGSRSDSWVEFSSSSSSCSCNDWI